MPDIADLENARSDKAAGGERAACGAAAQDQIGLIGGTANQAEDAFLVLPVDERSQLGLSLNRVSDPGSFECGDQTRSELVDNVILNENPADAGAHLAVQRQCAAPDLGQCPVKVGIVEHDGWRLAAEFKAYMFDGLGRVRHDDAAGP